MVGDDDRPRIGGDASSAVSAWPTPPSAPPVPVLQALAMSPRTATTGLKMFRVERIIAPPV